MKKLYYLFLYLLTYSLVSAQPSSFNFKRVALHEDLLFLRQIIMDVHPLFADSSFIRNWEEVYKKKVSVLSDSMTQNQFYLYVSPMLASMNDGHSNFSCPTDQRKDYMFSGGLSFPFSVKISGNSLIITEYYGDERLNISSNDKILEINSILAENLLDTMRLFIGGESDAIKNKTIEYNFRTLIWMIYGFEQGYSLKVQGNDGMIFQVEVDGINNEKFARNRKKYFDQKRELYSVKVDPSTEIGYLRIKSFSNLNEFCSFADSAFRIIKSYKIKNLFIDVRGNMGGRSIVVDSLMNYITDKNYCQYKLIKTRISEELKNYYQTKYPDKYKEIKDLVCGTFLETMGTIVTPQNNSLSYHGAVNLIVDNETYSAAATFAGFFMELGLGKTFGQKTGGTVGYYGDFMNYQLPNTLLQFYISPKWFVQFGGDDSIKKGITPDVVIQDCCPELDLLNSSNNLFFSADTIQFFKQFTRN